MTNTSPNNSVIWKAQKIFRLMNLDGIFFQSWISNITDLTDNPIYDIGHFIIVGFDLKNGCYEKFS